MFAFCLSCFVFGHRGTTCVHSRLCMWLLRLYALSLFLSLHSHALTLVTVKGSPPPVCPDRSSEIVWVRVLVLNCCVSEPVCGGDCCCFCYVSPMWIHGWYIFNFRLQSALLHHTQVLDPSLHPFPFFSLFSSPNKENHPIGNLQLSISGLGPGTWEM